MHKLDIASELLSNVANSKAGSSDTKIVEGVTMTVVDRALNTNIPLAIEVGLTVAETTIVCGPAVSGILGAAAATATLVLPEKFTRPVSEAVGQVAACGWDATKQLFRNQQDILARELELPTTTDLKGLTITPSF